MEKLYAESDALFVESSKLEDDGNKTEACSKRKHAHEILDGSSLQKRRNVFSSERYASLSDVFDVYDIFTTEPLHLFHLGISKRLKECTVSYLSSATLETNPTKKGYKRKKFKSCKNQLLSGCNNLLIGYQNDFRVTRLRVDFSSSQTSGQLNGFFTSTGVKGMLEGKDYHAIDTVFPFVAGFLDKATGFHNVAHLTTVHTLYSDLINHLLFNENNQDWPHSRESDISTIIKVFKSTASNLFGTLEDLNLFTLKFHNLDHIAEDVARFGDLSLLDASPYEHFNFTLKQFIRMTSMRKQTTISEAVAVINATKLCEDGPSVIERQMHAGRLSRDGDKFVLRDLMKPNNSCLSCMSEDEKSSFVTTLSTYIAEECNDNPGTFLPENVHLTCVKSGYIYGGAVMTMANLDTEMISIEGHPALLNKYQRVFADPSFGPSKKDMFSVVLIKSDVGTYWFGRVLVLFHLRHGDSLQEECAFVQYFDITPPMDEVDKSLRCICLRWSTDDGKDHSLRDPSTATIEAGEWYGIIPFRSIVSVHHIVRSNYPLPPFLPKLPWPSHRFYVNRFFDYRQ